MKANELRIGNLVFDNLGGTLRIKGIGTDEDLPHIKPIPLTEEWLERFGFSTQKRSVSLGVGGELQVYSEIILKEIAQYRVWRFIIWYNPRLGWTLMSNHVEGITYYIQYVHQLQNLFYTNTGEELCDRK